MNTHLQTLMELIQVPGESCKESAIGEELWKRLMAMGVPADSIVMDDAWRQSEYGGRVGNLIVRMDGHGNGQRRLLSTHMDTVPGAVGSKPRLDGDRVVNDAPDKALGGDARAGCACLLAAARALAEQHGRHGPRTLVFFVQEELGLVGSRGLDTSLLGDTLPAMGFNFDGSDPNELAYAVIGAERLNIHIAGVPAHAGRPRQGISAAIIAAEALAELQAQGWNGPVEKTEGQGTANVGILRGGKGSNVVMPELYGLAEARSFDRDFRIRIIEQWKEAFQRAVDRNNARAHQADGKASVTFSPGPVYDPYRLSEDSPVVQAAVTAMKACGLTPLMLEHWGGMDCNHVVSKGIPAVGLGMGDYRAHSVEEYVHAPQFLKACELAVNLALGE